MRSSPNYMSSEPILVFTALGLFVGAAVALTVVEVLALRDFVPIEVGLTFAGGVAGCIIGYMKRSVRFTGKFLLLWRALSVGLFISAAAISVWLVRPLSRGIDQAVIALLAGALMFSRKNLIMTCVLFGLCSIGSLGAFAVSNNWLYLPVALVFASATFLSAYNARHKDLLDRLLNADK